MGRHSDARGGNTQKTDVKDVKDVKGGRRVAFRCFQVPKVEKEKEFLGVQLCKVPLFRLKKVTK